MSSGGPDAAADAAASAPPLPLSGIHLVTSGVFPGFTHRKLQSRIEALGGVFSRSLTSSESILITTKTEFVAKAVKVCNALDKGVPIVGISWLEECEARKEKASTIVHDMEAMCLSDRAATVPRGASAGAAAAPSKKRAATDHADSTDHADAAEHDSGQSNVQKKKTKKDSAVAGAANVAGAASVAGAADVAADVAVAPLSTTAVADGQFAKDSSIRISADEHCEMHNVEVYIDPTTLLIFDAHLNQSNYSRNNNKFYKIQLLHDLHQGTYYYWTRYGRVGDHGVCDLKGDGSLAGAIKGFEVKFREKTGLAWSDRGADPKWGKYTFMQQNYEATENLENKLEGLNWGSAAASDYSGDSTDSDSDDPQTAPCTLEPEVQDLMRMIFNQKFFNAAMVAMHYDVKRLPLGKLSKHVILRAFRILQDLTDLLQDSSIAMVRFGCGEEAALEGLTSQYFTCIPHNVGRNRIPLLSSIVQIRKEIELLDTLTDMKDADDLMTTRAGIEGSVAAAATPHPLDRQFNGLGLTEMVSVDPSTEEYQEIYAYLDHSRGMTHNQDYRIIDMFRIERRGEEDRLEGYRPPWPCLQSDRRLLWHGSRCTNFGGILSQGLRIAPSEAPMSGYMFGKGVYLADMSSKSAQYCHALNSNKEGLLLLCEAELGSPMLKRMNSDHNAATAAHKNRSISTWGLGRMGPCMWKDASCVHPSLMGVKMPDMSRLPTSTYATNSALLYNEYICYDTAQIRMRYLLRVGMK